MNKPGEGRLLDASYLRSAYFKTLEQSEKLLDSFRFQWRMTEPQKQAVWVLLNDIVASRAKRHYGRAQPWGLKSYGHTRPWWHSPSHVGSPVTQGYDAQMERVLLLIDFLRARKDKSAAWVIVTWKRQFPQFEAVRFLKQWGVSVDEAGKPISYQSTFVSSVVSIDTTRRSFAREFGREPKNDDEFVEYWIKMTHKKESKRKPGTKAPGVIRVRNFRKKLDHYNDILSRTRDIESLDNMTRLPLT